MNEKEINEDFDREYERYSREHKDGFVKIKMPTYYIAKYSYEDLRAAVLAEREACAQLCDEKALYFQYDFIAPYDVADSCAEEIRARGDEMKDGIALESIAHPEGDPVPDDHEIDPDSLETVEIDIPINERIKELARQAGFNDFPDDKNGVWITDGYWDEQLERFAELVLKEATLKEMSDIGQEIEPWDTSDMAHRSGGLAIDDDDIQEYKKPWVGLTDEEISNCWINPVASGTFTKRNVYEAIEAKLKEKNHD
jgi:hypothetical protein